MTVENKNKKYEDPCWGHNCEKYTWVDDLRESIGKVYRENEDEVISYGFFLLRLGLKRSTPKHWKKCRPLNLKILEALKKDKYWPLL